MGASCQGFAKCHGFGRHNLQPRSTLDYTRKMSWRQTAMVRRRQLGAVAMRGAHFRSSVRCPWKRKASRLCQRSLTDDVRVFLLLPCIISAFANAARITHRVPVAHASARKPRRVDDCNMWLQALVDRTVILSCSHDFCSDCVVVWTSVRTIFACNQHLADDFIFRATEKASLLCSDDLFHRIPFAL